MRQPLLTPGTVVYYAARSYVIESYTQDGKHIVARPTEGHMPELLPCGQVRIARLNDQLPREFENEAQMQQAQHRFELIKPILKDPGNGELVKAIAEREKVGVAKLYRLVNRYRQTNLLTSLADFSKRGGKGKSRLDESLESTIQEVIDQQYMTLQHRSLKKVYQILQVKLLSMGIAPKDMPHPNTLFNRIEQIPKIRRDTARFGRKYAQEIYGELAGINPDTAIRFPYELLQLDHTTLDIRVISQ